MICSVLFILVYIYWIKDFCNWTGHCAVCGRGSDPLVITDRPYLKYL